MSSAPTFSIDQTDASQIEAHLRACNDRFVPPLSRRVDIGAYSHKIFALAERFEAWSEDHQLVGLVAAYCNDRERRTAYVTSVSVLPAWQGKGIASRLLMQCIAHARRLGFGQIELAVHAANAPAMRLYEQRGFVMRGAHDGVNTLRLVV